MECIPNAVIYSILVERMVFLPIADGLLLASIDLIFELCEKENGESNIKKRYEYRVSDSIVSFFTRSLCGNDLSRGSEP